MAWMPIAAPTNALPPRPVTVRAQSIPARHYFPEHSHGWNQLVYAISGVLTVNVQTASFVITPDQAVWLPTGTLHRVGSLLGVEFRSLWIAEEAGGRLPHDPGVFSISPLLQALIVEATAIAGQNDHGRYSSTSAFVYAFRCEMGRSPQAYMRHRNTCAASSL